MQFHMSAVDREEDPDLAKSIPAQYTNIQQTILFIKQAPSSSP